MNPLPFRGLSAWFSCSVHPATVRQWDQHGGLLAGESDADYLFSDDTHTKDTVRVYESQQDVIVVQSSWILEVLHRQCQVHDVPLGQHLLHPHYLTPVETSSLKPPPSSTNKGDPSTDVKEKVSNLDPSEAFLSTETVNKSASVMFAEYNAIWRALEENVNLTHLEDVYHVDQLQAAGELDVNLLYDFVTSDPQFKVRRIS